MLNYIKSVWRWGHRPWSTSNGHKALTWVLVAAVVFLLAVVFA